MDVETVEKYIEDFKQLELEEIKSKIIECIDKDDFQSKINDMYIAYNIIKGKKQREEADQVKDNPKKCTNLSKDYFVNYASSTLLFTCNETGEKLTVPEVKLTCTHCGACKNYVEFVPKDNTKDSSYTDLFNSDPESDIDVEDVALDLLRDGDQEDYHKLYCTKMFDEDNSTQIKDKAWYILKTQYPINHKMNKIVSVLKKVFDDKYTSKLEYITYTNVED